MCCYVYFDFITMYVELSQIATEFNAHCGPDARMMLDAFTKFMAKLGIPSSKAEGLYR